MRVAAKKRPVKVRPRTPARVRKKTRKRRVGAHQHPELIGLGLVAVGLFLGAVLYAGWNGGYVGGAIGDGFVSVVGGIAYLLPVAGVAIGALMVARSDLPQVGPFRTGLVVTTFGLALVLGSAHGGYLGQGLEDGLGRLIGSTGTQILGVFLVLAGVLLVTGASAGAIVRRSGLAVRSAARRPSSRRRRAAEPVPDAASAPSLVLAPAPAPIDGVEAFPDVVAPAPLLVLDPEPERSRSS